jgi:hypothetical protein
MPGDLALAVRMTLNRRRVTPIQALAAAERDRTRRLM